MIPDIRIERHYELLEELDEAPFCVMEFKENMYDVSIENFNDRLIDRDVSNETLKLLDKYGFEYKERE